MERILMPWEEIKQKYDDSDNETDSHLYFIGTKHPEFTSFPFEKGSVIIDPAVTYLMLKDVK